MRAPVPSSTKLCPQYLLQVNSGTRLPRTSDVDVKHMCRWPVSSHPPRHEQLCAFTLPAQEIDVWNANHPVNFGFDRTAAAEFAVLRRAKGGYRRLRREGLASGVALDGDGGHSPFVTSLIKRIETPRIEIRKLFDLVRDDVMVATDRHQQPFTYGSVPGSEDFYFAGTSEDAAR